MAPLVALGASRHAASPYPLALLYFSQALRLISSGIVVGQVGYFFWWLHHDHYQWPWTFIILSVASSLTILDVILVIAASLFGVTRPSLNALANFCLFFLWLFGMSLLIHNSGPTIAGSCITETWQNEKGIGICRIYKSLFTFTVIGFATSLTVLVMDAVAWHRAAKRGLYQRMVGAEETMMDPSEDPWAVPFASEHDRSSRSREEACNGGVDSVPHEIETSYEGGIFSGNKLDAKGDYTRL